MSRESKSVAIIPARGGSKRIPRKNIKEFLGRPIIAYSIETALESGLFNEVIVSTDDEEIAEVAKKYGAEIPFIRPKSLADDFVGTRPVINHAIRKIKEMNQKYGYFCTIYPTAPLLQIKYLRKGFKKLKNSDALFSFAATSMPYPIQRTFKITQNGRCQMFWPENFNKRSQYFDEAYYDAGQFYWQRGIINKNKNMFGKESIPIILPRYLAQDIDNLEDWKRTEILYELIMKKDNK